MRTHKGCQGHGRGMEPNDNRYSAELTLPAKPAAEEDRDLDGQIYALAMVVVEQKTRGWQSVQGFGGHDCSGMVGVVFGRSYVQRRGGIVGSRTVGNSASTQCDQLYIGSSNR